MNKHYSDAELERALFAMPLEETPAGLRASILAATVYRPPVTVAAWEVWLFGVLAALIVWICALVIRGGAGPAVHAVQSGSSFILGLLSQPSILLWIAIGGAAVWLSQLNLTALPGYQRAARR